jgi:hypothetical protein
VVHFKTSQASPSPRSHKEYKNLLSFLCWHIKSVENLEWLRKHEVKMRVSGGVLTLQQKRQSRFFAGINPKTYSSLSTTFPALMHSHSLLSLASFNQIITGPRSLKNLTLKSPRRLHIKALPPA